MAKAHGLRPAGLLLGTYPTGRNPWAFRLLPLLFPTCLSRRKMVG